jgi:hypothetical protein
MRPRNWGRHKIKIGDAVEDFFGGDIDYAMLIKLYGAT